METGKHWCSPSQPPELFPNNCCSVAMSSQPSLWCVLSPRAWGQQQQGNTAREPWLKQRAQLLSCACHSYPIPTDLWISMQEMSGACKLSPVTAIKNVEIAFSARSQSLFPWKQKLQLLNTCLALCQPLWAIVAVAGGGFSTAQTPQQGSAQLSSSTPSAPLRGNCCNSLPKAVSQCKSPASVLLQKKTIINIEINCTGSVLISCLTFHSSFS